MKKEESEQHLDLLEKLEEFKVDYHYLHPDASDEEYKKAVEEKAKELGL